MSSDYRGTEHLARDRFGHMVAPELAIPMATNRWPEAAAIAVRVDRFQPALGSRLRRPVPSQAGLAA
jgi:hypothetical protein